MSKVIGIDLGTTNSCISFFENGDVKTIVNAEGKNTTKSVVAYKDDEILVGGPAKRQALTNPLNTVTSIKRIMGLMIEEEKAKQAIEKVGYKIVSNSGACGVEINGKIKSPQEISAEILKKLKTDAETFLGETINDAVITVPAYFNNAQREATKEAGQIAGLNVLRIINEPTAAALAYGIEEDDKEETVLVYDLGGGTLDVTVLEIDDGSFEVLSTDGNAFLGGDDFDNAVAGWLVDEFKNENGIDLSQDKTAYSRLNDEAQKAKEELSATEEYEFNLPFITADATGPKHLVMSLKRDIFNDLTKHLVDESIDHIKTALKEAALSIDEIDEVIMVGGSTRIPAVNEAVEKCFNGKKLHKGVNPDEVVSNGAAIQGAILGGSASGALAEVLLVDITPLSLGIGLNGNKMSVLIEKGTSVPTSHKERYTNAHDNQDVVRINVLQGESEVASENKDLGDFELEIPKMDVNKADIEVTFNIDANGLLEVTAKELTTNKESQIQISGSSNLSDDEIEKLKNK